MSTKTVLGWLALVVLALGSLSLPAAAAAAAPAAESAGTARALPKEECWSTPGGQWRVTCISGPRQYFTQCNMMRGQKINAGYDTRPCKWQTWDDWGAGYYFMFG